MTIKHIEKTGRERVFSASSIERTPEGILAFGSQGEGNVDGKIVIASGRIFVMNEGGKTVANYDLDAHR